MPGADSQKFVVPTDMEKAEFAELVRQLLAGNAGRGGGLAAENNYELLTYQDRGENDATSWLLRELKPARKGWGLYAFRVEATQALIVEAPHPLADENTPLVALDIYRALHARALLVAGAHRHANSDGSADAAHNPQTIFNAIHEALTESGAPIVLQVHGFATSKHPGYPQIVLSHDLGVKTDLLEQLAAALTTQGLTVGVCDGILYTDLCGETNVQSLHMAAGVFIHIEMDETVRRDDRGLLLALAQVFP